MDSDRITQWKNSTYSNVYNFFVSDKNRGWLNIGLNRPVDRAVAALKISKSTLYRHYCGNESLPRRERALKYDDFDIGVIRRKVLSFFAKGEIATLSKLHSELLEDDPAYHLSRSTVYKIMKKDGFSYKKTTDNRKSLYDMPAIRASRVKFLREIKNYRDGGLDVVYVDETWLNEHDHVQKQWYSADGESSQMPPAGKGKRLIILHAGSAKYGFIENCSLVFEACKGEGDHHSQMNSDVFLDWWENNLLISLQEPSLIVIDNAKYHNTQVEETIAPNMKTKKLDMIQWLQNHDIPHDPTLLKVELYELIKRNKPDPVFLTDRLAHQYGHHVLRTPVRHCELNAIELIWAQLKNFVTKNNKTFKFRDLFGLYEDAIKRITVNDWKSVVKHTMDVS